ncbi:MAG: hypothetical protein LBH04_09275 [Tannerellaceae bacterium]|nr:hypothetical protein [Tannerellaceae bacterium]
MRNILIAIILLSSISICAFAHDLISLTNGNEIKACVKEVGENNIHYVNFNDPDGNDYTLKKSEILMIKYANGDEDMFYNAIPASITKQQEDLTKRAAALQAKYNSGRRQQITGNVLWITGLGMAIGGIGLMISSINEGNDTATATGVLLTVGGGILFNVGIPISIVGTARKGSAYRAMQAEGFANMQWNNDAIKKAAIAPKLRLNLHGTGAGLAYIF